MRTEIKAAIAVGLVVFVGAIIWAVNSSEKADQIPFDLPPGQTSGEEVALAGDERAIPGETTPAQPQPATPERTEEPSVLSYRPIRPGPEAPQPDATAAGPEADEGAASPETAGRPGELVATSAPATEGPALEAPGAGPRETTGVPDAAARVPPRRPPTSPKEDVASRLEGLKKPAAGSTYTIELGDTLIDIAREHYGGDRYWTAIQAANPDVDPQSLQPGQVIVLPPKEQVVAGEVKRVREKKEGDRATYVVAEGDTLIAIARNVLKDESRYLEIFELNRDKLESPDLLMPGTELRLPPLEKEPPEKTED